MHAALPAVRGAAAGRQAALPDGRRPAGGPARRRRRGHRPVRLRDADPQRPQRLGVHRRRPAPAAERQAPARSGPAGVRLPVLLPAAHFSRAYLHHLFVADEMLGPTLLSLHNLAYLPAADGRRAGRRSRRAGSRRSGPAALPAGRRRPRMNRSDSAGPRRGPPARASRRCSRA